MKEDKKVKVLVSWKDVDFGVLLFPGWPRDQNPTTAQYMYHMYIVIVYQRVIRELLLQDELEFFAFQDWDLGPGKHGIPAQEIWVISQRA